MMALLGAVIGPFYSPITANHVDTGSSDGSICLPSQKPQRMDSNRQMSSLLTSSPATTALHDVANSGTN